MIGWVRMVSLAGSFRLKLAPMAGGGDGDAAGADEAGSEAGCEAAKEGEKS